MSPKSLHNLETVDLEVFGWGFVIFCAMIGIFIVCQIGEMTTMKFDSFNDTFYQCEWYLFPTDIQRMLLIVMANAQQPVIIKGFANTLAARESFTKVN